MSRIGEHAALAVAQVLGAPAPTPIASRDWASATFSGTRYCFALEIPGDARAALATLPDLDIPLRGAFVADATVLSSRYDGTTTAARIELLTIETEI